MSKSEKLDKIILCRGWFGKKQPSEGVWWWMIRRRLRHLSPGQEEGMDGCRKLFGGLTAVWRKGGEGK